MRPLVLVAALVFATTLTACSSPYTDHERAGGITPAAAEAQLLDIQGFTAADYQTAEWYSPGEGGMFSASGMNVILSVTIDPQYSIADDSQFVEFLAATAWSVNDHYPKGQIVLAIAGGLDPIHDWGPAVQEIFGQDGYVSESVLNLDKEDIIADDATSILVNAEYYAEVFGAWPSKPVSTPSGLLIKEPPVVPAISDATLTEVLNDAGEECVRVEFVRGETFSGTVTVNLLDAEGSIVRTQDTSTSELESCFFAGKRPVGGSATIEAAVERGYSAVELTVTPERGN